MKKLAILLVVLAALVAPLAASAHPLGNFTSTARRRSSSPATGSTSSTCSTWRRSRPSRTRQAGVGQAAYLRRIERGAASSRSARLSPSTPVAQRLAHPKGPGWPARRPGSRSSSRGPSFGDGSQVAYRRRDYSGRIGWKEVVVVAAHGGSVTRLDAVATSRSDSSARVSEGSAPQPARRHAADRDVSPPEPPAGPAPALLLRQSSLSGARPRRRLTASRARSRAATSRRASSSSRC